MTVIVLNHVHRTDLSRSILSLLVLKNDPDKIRATPLFFLGTLLTGLGGYIRYKCYKEMGTMFTFEMCIRREHRLVTSGPYGIVRHPGYTGILCAVTGVVLWSLSTVSTVHDIKSHLTTCQGLLGQGKWRLNDHAWSIIMLDVLHSRVYDMWWTHFSDVQRGRGAS